MPFEFSNQVSWMDVFTVGSVFMGIIYTVFVTKTELESKISSTLNLANSNKTQIDRLEKIWHERDLNIHTILNDIRSEVKSERAERRGDMVEIVRKLDRLRDMFSGPKSG